MSEHDLSAIAFPKFDAAQLTALERCPLTTRRSFHAGETLFHAGQRGSSFFVVKSGEVAILDDSGEAQHALVVVHEPGEFTGDVSQVTGAPAVVSAVARGDCDVYEISPDALRSILNNHPDLGDRILQAFIARRQLLRESGSFAGLRVIGSRYSQSTFRIRDFLARNRVLFTWLDIEADPAVGRLFHEFGVTEVDTPLVVWGQRLLLRNPSERELAEAIGLSTALGQQVYDLVIVGAGPAGLAAAVYGASEGLSTLVLERTGPGGQAGRSMRIENYLGFPTGITGAELTDRAVMQANKFGARLPVPTPVASLSFDNAYKALRLESGETVTTKCVLLATGAEYRRLGVNGCEPFEGRGVYYAATVNEIAVCRGAPVIVVGGGNSAGQAAVFLAGQMCTVYLLIRGDDLYRNMSSYLVHRIEQTANITLLKKTEVRRMSGDGHLSAVVVADNSTGAERTLQTPALFSFIGAVPRTDWLPAEIEKDARGFIRTGADLAQSPQWSAHRTPFLLETSRPGVFAAGDVRSGSVKRVASAVGEGSMAVQFVHEYLKEM